MSTSLDKRRRLIESMKDKEYRDLCVESNIRNGIAFQIRAMRDARKWTQNDLAARADKKQEVISQVENPNYAAHTLKTLRRLASAFDVALVVRFVPFSQLADWIVNLSPDDLAVPSFDDDHQLEEPSRPVMVGSCAEVRLVASGGTVTPEPSLSRVLGNGQVNGVVREGQAVQSSNVTNIWERRPPAQVAASRLATAGTI